MNILIYAKPKTVEHKMEDQIGAGLCWWRVSRGPKEKVGMIRFVYEGIIYAQGKYIGYFRDEDGVMALHFRPLVKAKLKACRKPPMQGWCYEKKGTG